MIRGALKTAAAFGLHATGADRLIGRLGRAAGGGHPALVLCYHRVVEDPGRHPLSAPAMLVGVETLERQLDWIGRRYRFVGLDELARSLDGGTPARPGRPLAAVTFDDGYADNYHLGFPLLREKGIPGAFFVSTDLVGTGRLHLHDELYALLRLATERLGDAGPADLLTRLGLGALWLGGEGAPSPARLAGQTEQLLRTLPRRRVTRLIRRLRRVAPLPSGLRDELVPMTWEMLAELHHAGMTIGSHTRSHRVLPNEPRADVYAELAGSKRALDERLGTDTLHVSYPDGQFCPRVLEAAHAAGYRWGYTTCGHRSDERPRLTIPRRTFWERTTAGWDGGFSPSIASCQVEGVFERLRPCRSDHGPNQRPPAPPMPALGPFRLDGGAP